RIHIDDPVDEAQHVCSYELRWEPTGLADTTPASEAAFLILADHGGIGRTLATLLKAQGSITTLLDYSPVAGEPGPSEEAENSLAHIGQTVADAVETLADRDIRVVFLWALDSTPTEATTTISLQADQLRGAGSVLALVQRLVKLKRRLLPRLWLV